MNRSTDEHPKERNVQIPDVLEPARPGEQVSR